MKKSEQRDATRARVVAAARRLFAAQGYEHTSTEALLAELSISRGALYHHFKSKEALFEAVLEAVETDVAKETASAAAGATDAPSALRAGINKFFELARTPEVRQIVLIDAHSVVGWRKWREIEERYALGQLKTILSAAAAAGLMDETLVDMSAHILLASLVEVAFLVARSEHPEETVLMARRTMNRLVDRMF